VQREIEERKGKKEGSKEGKKEREKRPGSKNIMYIHLLRILERLVIPPNPWSERKKSIYQSEGKKRKKKTSLLAAHGNFCKTEKKRESKSTRKIGKKKGTFRNVKIQAQCACGWRNI